jgi:hypothetical protein
MPEIEITFNTDGTSEIHSKGTKGKSCKDVTAFFEKALGNKTSDKNTQEYYEVETNNNILRRR